jgi:methyltransferase (TIGR00027 family)
VGRVTTGQASRTALVTALMRAIHTRRDRPRLIDDPWGDRLVPDAEKTAIYRRAMESAEPETRSRLERLGSEQAVVDAVLRAHRTYGGVIVRSRCAEDALEAAVARGVRQYVLVGAGFDSFIVRQPAFARGIDVFEIDQPASQAMKRRRLEECAVEVPPNVHFVAADLSAEPLASVLGRCGFSSTVPAFFSWLGVTIYLPREANVATLRGIASASAPGSELIFTYIDQRVLDGARSAELERMRASRAAQGEPWVSGFDPTTLGRELEALGLGLVEDLSSRELHARYCADRTDGLSPGVAGHVARATVAAKSIVHLE